MNEATSKGVEITASRHTRENVLIMVRNPIADGMVPIKLFSCRYNISTKGNGAEE